jgi:hypothetical protein
MRRGPQPNFVRDRHDNMVNGLRIQRAKNRRGRDIERYSAVDSEGRRKYFGNRDDRPTAILRFRQWEAQQEATSRSRSLLGPLPSGKQSRITRSSHRSVRGRQELMRLASMKRGEGQWVFWAWLMDYR